TDVVSGTTVYCHADDSGSPTRITRHEWDMNDDGSYSSGGTAPRYSFATPGNYTVHLRVTDSKGKQSTSTVDIHVDDRAPVPSMGVRPRVIAGQPATFDASGSTDPDGSIVAWEWDLDNDGVFERSGQTAT